MTIKRQIPFNVPLVLGTEKHYVEDAISSGRLCGDNAYTKRCQALLEERFGARKTLLTTSCTHALEMQALLCNIQPEDEVIMSSYTFVSTANAFALRGARIVFVDIRPDTQNLDENLIEEAITAKTRAIVPVHYAGVGCEMDTICEIARRYSLRICEDAAQGVNAYYKGRALGTIGDFGAYSFHETKNYTMGEGGALLIGSEADDLCAEIIREKGTNRLEFLRGQTDKYTWVDRGSSYLPSELNAAFLYAQLLQTEEINEERLHVWQRYMTQLTPLEAAYELQLPVVPEECRHNGHMFYLKLRTLEERTRFIRYMKDRGVSCQFHYVPLHASPFGRRCSVFHGTDRYTTDTAERLVRLPMYMGLSDADIDYICEQIHAFFRGN